MDAMTKQQRADLLDSIPQVAMGCPVERCNPIDCPLHMVRKMDLPHRVDWFYSLNNDDLSYLVSYHNVCLNNKLESHLEPSQALP